LEARGESARLLLAPLDLACFALAQRGLVGVGEILLAMTSQHPPYGAAIFCAPLRNSLRVPLRALEALLGSLTPSMANSCRPTRPWRSHPNSTWVKRRATASPPVATNSPRTVKPGRAPPQPATT